MGRKKNKGKKKKVSLSLSEFSQKYGVELFEEENFLLPTDPSGIIAPSPQQNDEYLQKDNWRGSNVRTSNNDVEIGSNADTEINWRKKSLDTSKFSFRNKENSKYIPRVSKFTTTNGSNINSYSLSNKKKFTLNNSNNSQRVSKFLITKKESKNIFVPSGRFNLKKDPSSSVQFNKYQEDLSKNQDIKYEEKNIPNILENKDVELLKKKKKKKKKKKNTFFLTDLTQEEKDMIKESLISYEDIDEKKEINEQSEEDDDYSESGENISRNYYGFKPKYI